MTWGRETKPGAGCAGKGAYATPQLAHAVLKRRKWDKARADLQAYRCPTCGLYHLGGTARKRAWKSKR